jgi:predicted enzyme related to lactoylglutathione lyase
MKNYDNFFLGVSDLEEARSFYEQKLELQLKFDFSKEGMLAYHIGKEEPAIILKDQNVFKNMKPTIWFEVDDVNKEYIKLKEKGIVFLSEPFRIYTGMAVEFEDPFGNRLGFTDYSR